jgi:hypothetical protein
MAGMLLGSSFEDKQARFLVLKTASLKIAGTQEENVRFRHSFGKVMWKTIEHLSRERALVGSLRQQVRMVELRVVCNLAEISLQVPGAPGTLDCGALGYVPQAHIS